MTFTKQILIPSRSWLSPSAKVGRFQTSWAPSWQIFRLYTWVALITFAIGQNAMAVLTNYINRPFMACGAEHALVLKSDGTVLVWGNNSHSKQLGGAIQPYFGNNDVSTSPAPVPGVLGGVAVAAGSYHSLVLKWDGTVLAFGENGNGQLGVGDTLDKGTA